MRKIILCGVLGGMVLGLLFSVTSFLPSCDMEIFLFPLIGLGSIVAAIVLLYKNRSVTCALVRTVIMFACSLLTMRLLLITGVIRKASDLLHIQISEADSRAAGLGLVFFLVILCFESVVIQGVLLIRRARETQAD